MKLVFSTHCSPARRRVVVATRSRATSTPKAAAERRRRARGFPTGCGCYMSHIGSSFEDALLCRYVGAGGGSRSAPWPSHRLPSGRRWDRSADAGAATWPPRGSFPAPGVAIAAASADRVSWSPRASRLPLSIWQKRGAAGA
jgi:hypothetical protein